jgi:hypothetical protein
MSLSFKFQNFNLADFVICLQHPHVVLLHNIAI